MRRSWRCEDWRYRRTIQRREQSSGTRLHLVAAKASLLNGRVEAAKPHLDAVLKDNEYAGWGHLMTAAIQFGEGYYERANQQLRLAERKLGRCYEVNLLSARTHLALGNWDQSLQYLKLVRNSDFARAGMQPWTTAEKIDDAELNWAEFRARLGLADWKAVEQLLPTFQGTRWDASARAACAARLWRDHHAEEAQRMLDAALTSLPHNVELVRRQADIWSQGGRDEEALQLVEQAAAAEAASLPHQLLRAAWLKRVRGVPSAIVCLESVVQQFPQNVEPRLLKAEMLLEQGDVAQTLELLSDVDLESQTAAWGNLLTATALQMSNDLAGASARLETLSGTHANAPAAGLLQGQLALARDDVATAVEELAESLDVGRLRSLATRLTILAAVKLIDQQGAESAESVLQKLADEKPNDPVLWLLQAECCFRQGAADRAFKALDCVERLQSGEPSGPFFKSLAYYRLGQFPAALREAQRAVEMKLEYVPALVIGAKAGYALGQHEAALRLAQFANKLDPHLWEMQLIEAQCLFASGSHQQAIASIDKVIQEQPDMQAAYLARVELLSAVAQWKEALEACHTARENMSDAPAFDVHELNVLLHLQQQQQASAVIERISSSNPTAPICLATGQVLATHGDLEAAETWGQRALEQGTVADLVQINLFLGEVLANLGQHGGDPQQFQAARRHFEAVLAKDPEHLPAANNLAWLIAERLGKPEEAIEIALRAQGKRAVRDLPEYFLDTLATILRQAKKQAEALTLIDQGLKVRPASSSLLYQRGVLLAGLGRHDEARTSLQSALLAGLSEPRQTEASEWLKRHADSPTDSTTAEEVPVD